MNFAGKSAFLALLATFCAGGAKADPMPYAPIAMPFPDSAVDQIVRDSATMHMGRVRVNQAGYRTMDVAAGMAKFYHVGTGTAFSVYDTTAHAAAGTGTLVDKGFQSGSKMDVKASNWAGLVNNGDTRYVMSSNQFGTTIAPTETYEGTLPTTLTPSHFYRVVVGKDTSVPFLVSDSIYSYARDAVLKYFGIARSGNGPSWFHAPSHLLDGYRAIPSNPGAYKGGWYDCGDHLKEPQTMAYALAALSTIAATMPTHDADHYGLNHSKTLQTDGIPDIIAEAHFGAQFFVNSWKLHGDKTGPNSPTDSGMITGVGNYGDDHGWWGRPENQDAMLAAGRGGYKERDIRAELGANTLGDVAAGLAILSRLYRPYNSGWADTALLAAKDMYAYAKTHLVVVSTPAYSGAGADKVNANLALAATALLWVTKDTSYLDDIAYNKTIGTHGATFNTGGGPTPMLNSWLGGWMVMSNPNLTKGGANTDWANRHQVALYAFYKLILADPDSALTFGVASEAERQNLVTHDIAGVIQNLSSIGQGTGVNIPLPTLDPNDGGGYAVRATSDWFLMYVQMEWVWNRYYMGNPAELYFYYDITNDLAAGKAGATLTSKQWNRDQVRQLIIRMLDYQLGDNPWDVSMFMGIGKKNFNHPSHRASNPEGRNTPGASYQYHSPTGALFGGWSPYDSSASSNGQTSWSDYDHTEVCLDGAATSLFSLTGMALEIPQNTVPHVTVKVLDALDTTADIEVDLDKYGTVVLNWGLAQGTYTQSVKSDSSGVVFTFHLSKLAVGTQYFFDVVASDIYGDDTTYSNWTNPAPAGTPYNFTTLPQIQGNSQITGVKVCNVTADSAEIMWYTPNGEYQSSVCYGTVPPVGSKTGGTTTCVMDADISGHATKFHQVEIGGLQEKTTYYFKVASDGSNGVWDDNAGQDYQFTTPVKMANFGVYAVQYTWSSGEPALAINVVNNEAHNYDSLTLRVYVRSKDTVGTHLYGQPIQTLPMSFPDAMGARYDICQAYDGAGFNHPCSDSTWGNIPGGNTTWVWGNMNNAVQLLRPVKMPDTYDSATGTYAYYYDLPLGPTMMQQGSRIRFDVIFAQRSQYTRTLGHTDSLYLNWISGFVPDQAKITDPLGWWDLLDQAFPGHPMGSNTTDWSWEPHSKAAGAPVDFIGIPNVGTQTAANGLIDALSDSVPLDPYITVYRKGEFVYGYSPSAAEQATKKTTWALNVKLNPPFDVPGATITLDQTKSTVYATGTADVFDALTPAAKGSVTDIWVNGVRLPPSKLAAAAIWSPTANLWNLNIPVALGLGGNSVDITIFGGNGACPDTSVTCASGCAFDDLAYFIQFSKGKSTQSRMALVDGTNTAVGPLVKPDSSFVNVRVTDNDNNISATSLDHVRVTLTDLRTNLVDTLVLTETGDSTGIFESGLLPVTSGLPGAGKISVPPGDSVLVKYMDVNDSTDSSQAYLYAKAMWPTPASAGLYRDCGGSYSVKALFNLPFAPGGWDTARVVLNVGKDSIVDKVLPTAITADVAGTTLTIPLPAGLSSGGLTGRLDIQEANGQGGWIKNSVAISDDIGPWVDSIKIAENVSGAVSDSVYFWASELFTSTAPWPFLVERAGTAVPASAFSGAAISLLDAATDKYLAVLPAGILMAGDSVRFDPSLVADGKGNAALDCPGGRKVQTISVSYAGLGASLTEACGGAYSVKALFNKAFPATGGWDTGFVTLSSGATTVGPFAVPPGSISMDATGKTLTLPLPGLTYGSGWTGRLDLQVTGDTGAMHLVSVPVSDGVGPWIDSAKIVQNLTGNPVDSVLVFASEPLVLSSGWPFLVERAGSAVPASAFAGANISLLDTASNKYLVLLPAGDLASGDSLRLAPASATDRVGNAALDCPSLLRRVTLVLRPAPLGKAWILDASGDGRADEVVLVFKKTVTATDLPDSVVIRFGIHDSSRIVAVSMAQATDSILTIPLPLPFSFGLTSGSAADGSGSISLWKSGEPVGPYVLSDSVGPALVSAAVRYGSTTDTLSLVFSEPVRRGAGAGWLLAQPATELGTSGAPDSLSPTQWLLPIVAGSVSPGDSVRPVPTEQWAEGRTGRSVAPAQPWIPVTGGERPPLYGWYRDIDGNGAVDQAVVVFSKTPKTRPGMLLLWPSAANGFDTAKVDSGSWNLNPDGLSTTIPVGPFAEGVTASPTTKLGQWLSGGVWNFPMYDSVPPVLVSATVRYGSRDSVPDTLHVRWSEPIDWNGAGSLVRHRLAGVENPVLAVNGIPDADGMGEMILMASDTLQLRKGDSAAFSAGSVTDLHGNVVPQTTRWVPVTFGMRPVQISFVFQSYMEYTGWDPPSGPAMQVWVRARGDAVWLKTDGSVVSDTTHVIGATITINNPIGGSVYIYDNAGIFVASLDLSPISALDARGLLPTDPSGMYQIRIGWDGMTEGGNWASSGIYLMRIVLKGAGLHGGTTTGIFNQVYKLGFKRPTK